MQQRTAAPHTPCWTELTVPDPEAAKAFYGDVFGWRADAAPRPEAGGYTVFRLGDAPVAAVAPLLDESQPTAWGVCLAVEDAERTASRAAEHGGSTLMPPTEVFDLGRYGVLADSEGAAFSVWESGAQAGGEILGDPGSPGWIELCTRDPRQALAFYPSVFGWTTHLTDFATEWSLGGARFGGLVDLNQVPAPAAAAPAHWKPYFKVADVDEAAARAAGAGGRVLLAPADVPGEDLRAGVLRDPQGAQFGVYAEVAASDD
jgi:hypothetical protein